MYYIVGILFFLMSFLVEIPSSYAQETIINIPNSYSPADNTVFTFIALRGDLTINPDRNEYYTNFVDVESFKTNIDNTIDLSPSFALGIKYSLFSFEISYKQYPIVDESRTQKSATVSTNPAENNQSSLHSAIYKNVYSIGLAIDLRFFQTENFVFYSGLGGAININHNSILYRSTFSSSSSEEEVLIFQDDPRFITYSFDLRLGIDYRASDNFLLGTGINISFVSSADNIAKIEHIKDSVTKQGSLDISNYSSPTIFLKLTYLFPTGLYKY